MEMAWANVKIHHFFGFTSLTERSIGAGPPVIIQLNDANWFLGLMAITTDQRRSYAWNKILRPPGFCRVSTENLDIFAVEEKVC
jgi:hypothetical protein